MFLFLSRGQLQKTMVKDSKPTLTRRKKKDNPWMGVLHGRKKDTTKKKKVFRNQRRQQVVLIQQHARKEGGKTGLNVY